MSQKLVSFLDEYTHELIISFEDVVKCQIEEAIPPSAGKTNIQWIAIGVLVLSEFALEM